MTTVLVMAKAPEPGRVKTRLCPPCDARQAASIAEAALADTLDATARSGADRLLLALDGEPGAWLPPGFDVVAQVGTTFADRLAAAWSEVVGPCLQIGMDTPQVTPALLGAGLDELERSDAALGPATDGGWWALGMRTPRPSVFAGVPMSTHRTGVVQAAALRAAGLDPVLLPELCDVDTMADALEVAATIPHSRTAAAVRLVVSAVGA
jgi:rSAM/selenodomain-associated transferase 1